MTAFVISNAGGNWNAAATYVANSGFPVAGDTVTATGTSGQITVNVASACASIILTNYVATMTFDSTLTLTSTCTFVAGMTIAGTAGTLICTGTATLTSGGKTLTCALTMTGTVTLTMSGTWTVNGLVTAGGTTLTTTINSSTINCAGGITFGGSTAIVTGTTLFKLTGTGTWTGQSSTGAFRNNLTVDASGFTITTSGTIRFNTGTLTWAAGTMAGGGVLTIAIACTLSGWSGSTLSTGQWPSIIQITAAITVTLTTALNASNGYIISAGGCTFSGAFDVVSGVGGAMQISGGVSGTITFGGALTIGGNFTSTNTTATTLTGAGAISVAGNTQISGTQTFNIPHDVTLLGQFESADATVVNGSFNLFVNSLKTTGNLSGTSTIVFAGTSDGNWFGGAGICTSNVTINCPGFLLRLDGTFGDCLYATGTLTYTAGTFIVVSSGRISIATACTFATSGTSFPLIITAAITLTINNSGITFTTLTMPNANLTFAGSQGFTCDTLTATAITATRTYTFSSGETYTILVAFTLGHAAAQTVRYTLTAAATAFFVVGPGATVDLGFVDPINIDALGGQPIFTYKGSFAAATCPNWYSTLTDETVASYRTAVRVRPLVSLGM